VIGWLRRRRAEAAAAVSERLGDGAHLDDAVRFFGSQSVGRVQLRGNGCLGANANELLFVMWWPRREVAIDRRRIVGVETPRSHLGKSVVRPLLRVRFETAEGKPDAAAWYVRDLDRWLEVLERPVAGGS
jgi:hypothetical protein